MGMENCSEGKGDRETKAEESDSGPRDSPVSGNRAVTS